MTLKHSSVAKLVRSGGPDIGLEVSPNLINWPHRLTRSAWSGWGDVKCLDLWVLGATALLLGSAILAVSDRFVENAGDSCAVSANAIVCQR